jgi:hypothetical protein
MAAIHITEAELARDLHSVLEKVRGGAEVIVEHQPVAVLRPPAPPKRTISEAIALAKKREEERGYAVTLDPDFADDVQDVVNSRKPWTPANWD